MRDIGSGMEERGEDGEKTEEGQGKDKRSRHRSRPMMRVKHSADNAK